MPSIYQCHFLGNGWSSWEKLTVLEELPEEFVVDGTSILLTFRAGTHICYLYHPDHGQLTWALWNAKQWGDWAKPISVAAPISLSLEQEDAYFSVISHHDNDWLVSVNLTTGSVYGSPIEPGIAADAWIGPSLIEPAPNWDESTDVFVANEDDVEWIVTINLENQSVFFCEWDGEEYSVWEQVPSLPLAESWLEVGLDLDGAIVDGQLQIYAIVYDDDSFQP